MSTFADITRQLWLVSALVTVQSNSGLSEPQFQAFASVLRNNTPFVTSVTYAPHVTNDTRASFEATYGEIVVATTNGSTVPAPLASDYYPTLMVEPRCQSALIDLLSKPDRPALIHTAVTTGDYVVSPIVPVRLNLSSNARVPSITVTLPVFAYGAPAVPNNVLGIVTITIKAECLLDALPPSTTMMLSLTDITDNGNMSLNYSRAAFSTSQPDCNANNDCSKHTWSKVCLCVCVCARAPAFSLHTRLSSHAHTHCVLRCS